MSVGEVEEALEQVESEHEAEERTELSERLDEAVAAGDLTEAAEAAVLKAFDAGVLGGRPARPRPRPRRPGPALIRRLPSAGGHAARGR